MTSFLLAFQAPLIRHVTRIRLKDRVSLCFASWLTPLHRLIPASHRDQTFRAYLGDRMTWAGEDSQWSISKPGSEERWLVIKLSIATSRQL